MLIFSSSSLFLSVCLWCLSVPGTAVPEWSTSLPLLLLMLTYSLSFHKDCKEKPDTGLILYSYCALLQDPWLGPYSPAALKLFCVLLASHFSDCPLNLFLQGTKHSLPSNLWIQPAHTSLFILCFIQGMVFFLPGLFKFLLLLLL